MAFDIFEVTDNGFIHLKDEDDVAIQMLIHPKNIGCLKSRDANTSILCLGTAAQTIHGTSSGSQQLVLALSFAAAKTILDVASVTQGSTPQS